MKEKQFFLVEQFKMMDNQFMNLTKEKKILKKKLNQMKKNEIF